MNGTTQDILTMLVSEIKDLNNKMNDILLLCLEIKEVSNKEFEDLRSRVSKIENNCNMCKENTG